MDARKTRGLVLMGRNMFKLGFKWPIPFVEDNFEKVYFTLIHPVY